jgi:hypothetical protein
MSDPEFKMSAEGTQNPTISQREGARAAVAVHAIGETTVHFTVSRKMCKFFTITFRVTNII